MTTRRIIQIAVVLMLIGGIGNFIYTAVRTRNALTLVANIADPTAQEQGIRDLMARGALFDALQGGSPPETRLAAIAVLGRMAAGGKDPAAFAQLLLLLKDPDNESTALKTHPVRDAATAEVAVVGAGYPDALLDAAKDPDGSIHDQARAALKTIGAPLQTQIAARLGDKDLRVPLGDILVNIGPQTVPLIAPYLQAPLLKAPTKDDSTAKTDLITTMGKFKTASAAQVIIPFATDPDPTVRRTVIASLANIDVPEGAPVLIAALRDPNSDASARAAAAGALGVIATPAAVAALGTALSDDDLAVASAAADGLRRSGDAAQVAIAGALEASDPAVRARGALASGGLTSPALAEKALASDSDPSVRAEAARSVGDILVARRVSDTPAFDPLLAALADRDGTVAQTAEKQLGRLGSAVVPALVPRLGAANDTVAYYVAQALQAIGRPAVPELVAVASPGQPAARWAAVTLGQIGDPRATTALEALKSSPDADTAYVASAALTKVQPGG